MILMGSRSFVIRFPGIQYRKPVDFDFMCSMDELDAWLLKYSYTKKDIEFLSETKARINRTEKCEFELKKDGSSTDLLIDLISNDKETIKTSLGLVPSLNVLFLFKKSHRFLKDSLFFWKTLSDYHLMKKMGAFIPNEYTAALSLREKETYSYKHPRLNVTKDKFFDGDQVEYVYDHDSIHEAVKLFDRPAYTFFQKDGEQVAVDKTKFFKMSRELQLASIVEEASVLAIERSLVPFPGVLTVDRAFRFAFSKVLTSITSGWWREFAYENAFDALKLYKNNYWERFNAAKSSGLIKCYKA